MANNIGISMKQAMIDLGYSESYAHSGQLKKTSTWQKLMRKYLPDKKLVKVIKEGLSADKVISARIIIKKGKPTPQADGELPVANSSTNDFIEVPDHAVRHRFVETALKMKGKLVDKTDITSDGKKLDGLVIIKNGDSVKPLAK